ncbi:hypothetical protein V1460_19740 [Streptomyces sp. SCSIO 30461]|uniref:hypothetical protein n=1 Tax=Streptomyces sp. SCSIO 30461 TaxID=3118085 RepID=UPI0030CE6E4B
MARVVVIAASRALTWWMLPQVKVSDADPAGVGSLAVGVVGTAAGVVGLAIAVRSARQQRTGEAVAQLRAIGGAPARGRQGAEYRKLLGGGTSALDGRIDLPCTVVTETAFAFGSAAHVADASTGTPGRGEDLAAALGFTLAWPPVPVWPLALVGGWSGAASLRCLALQLCTRGRLPWCLGRFRHTCRRLGLLSTAGAGYRFRYRELQDHLAAAPTPPPGYRGATRL